MIEDPSREDDELARAFRPRARSLGVMIGCFLLGGAGAAMYGLRAHELLHEPAPIPAPDVHFVAFDIDDEDDGSPHRHKGEEGKMGKPTAKNKSGLYAMKGPRDAMPMLARGFDPDLLAVPDAVRGEGYVAHAEQAFMDAADDTRSTFSIDVDTASFSNVRRFIHDRQLPPPDAVRIEELINYFDYAYPQPDGDVPFSVTTEVGPCPWNEEHRLVHIGLQGRVVPPAAVPPRNLVFLVDVSGSMNQPDKLPLLRSSLQLLAQQLRPEDKVGIVVYAGASGIVLDTTTGDEAKKIRTAIEELESGGSTNGGAGIELAYRVAERGFVEGGINRVVLATDGDFNVGLTSDEALHELIAAKRETGVFLSVLGFGTGNLQDGTMELLADKGNGNYAYIDTLDEARKVLVDEIGGTLMTIAKDVKIQVEVDPEQVASFRLIGYDNRKLAHADFTDDAKDAGEIGSGHSVTALYEVVPVQGQRGGELMHVKLRWKAPDGVQSSETNASVVDRGHALVDTSEDFRFAAAAAEVGLLLRKSEHAGDASWSRAIALADGARSRDVDCRRFELVALAVAAAELSDVSVELPSLCVP